MNISQPRRGYALVVVILFLTLFMGLWGVAARQVATMLRIEQARSNRARREADSLDAMKALAQGLAALEVGYPPSSPYVVGVDGTGFTLTFTMNGTSGTTSTWSVQASPNSSLLPPTDPYRPTLNFRSYPPQFSNQHP